MSEDSSVEAESSPFVSQRFILAVFFIGVVAVLGIVFAITGALNDGEEDSSAEGGQAVEGGETPGYEGTVEEAERPEDFEERIPRTDYSESECGLQGTEETGFSTFPDDTAWESVGPVDAPSSVNHGPGETEESGYRHCYAHSPEGAVLAAANMAAMAGEPEMHTELATTSYAEGEGRQAVLDLLEEGRGAFEDWPSGPIGGARLVSYGADRARSEVLVQPSGAAAEFTAFPIDLRWEDGDWKVVTREDGRMMAPARPVEGALDSYVLR